MKKGVESVAELLRRISQTNETELSQVVLAVLERYRTLFPQEEVIFLSLPRNNSDERRRILEYACLLAEEEISD